MQMLGERSGWVFYEHAGSAVAVDRRTGDITDIFSASPVLSDAPDTWEIPRAGIDLHRTKLLASASLAASIDTTKIFPVPSAVQASARQALNWHKLYKRGTLTASAAHTADLISVPPAVRDAVLSVADRQDIAECDRRRVMQLASADQVPTEVVDQLYLFFSRHDKKSTSRRVWDSWGGDAGQAWSARVMAARTSARPTLTETLAHADVISYDTLKLLPRAFSVISSPHELSCVGDGQCSCGGSRDSSRYPSERAITFASLGGNQARAWSSKIVAAQERAALIAAGYDPDAFVVEDDADEGLDPSQVHVFAPIPSYPVACVYCQKDEIDEIHDESAVDYSLTDIDPKSAHYFYAEQQDPEKCTLCGEAPDGELHKQAALAAYYDNKEEWDKRAAEARKYWEGKDQGLSASASTFGIDWIEEEFPSDDFDLMEHVLDVDESMENVAWTPRNDFDPMTFYVAYSGGDPMSVDQIYVTDGPLMYRYDAYQRNWAQGGIKSPAQMYEIDVDTAHAVIRALSTYPSAPVDLREVEPGEALMMEMCLPVIEDELDGLDRYVIVASTGATFDYTPEERAENAKKQVRDANGRFAKSGSRVSTADGVGTINKINQETQQVEVMYDNGTSAWVDAKSVQVVDQGPVTQPIPDPKKLPDMIKGIPGKPRATAGTPKATLPNVLQPMSAEGLAKVISDYEAQIAEDRARAAEIAEREKEDRAASVIAAGEGTAITGPESSDVKPLYLAVVDEADSQAVLDLLAMTPASTTGTETTVWRRTPAGWERDDSMLRKMRSSAPPPIVTIEEADFPDVLSQVDTFYKSEEGKQSEEDVADTEAAPVAASLYGPYGEILPTPYVGDAQLIAAGVPGIADTPEDVANVNRLKRYWLVGEGAAKIRWNTPGDMTRCMRQLRKYMHRPGMAEGYCAKLHKEATGMWPGDRNDVGRRASGVPTLFETKFLNTDQVINYSALIAGAQVSLDGTPPPDAADQVPTEMTGASFLIKVLAPVGVRSGDGRTFSPLALSMRELPLPLLWQVQTQDGHDASVIVGRIDSCERAKDGSLKNARGVFDTGPYGREAERLVRHRFLRGVSVDLDEFEAEARSGQPDPDESDELGVVKIRSDEMTITNGRVMGATLVAKPAFQEVTIELDENEEEVEKMADGTYIGTPESDAETEAMVRSALTAAGIPLHPPVEWFDNPKLTERVPLTIEDDGRVFGHIATWDREHIGLPFSTTPPKSRSNYAYFHTGSLRTQQGVDVPVGQITLAGGHADLNADAAMAVKHYDDTASAMCDVHAGEDQFGIWVAGALRPSVTGEQVRAIRASAPSGDWRPINGRLELVAVCQVNVPGFPITRARVASGHVFALVAAGTSTLNRIRQDRGEAKIDALLQRVDALEAPQRDALASAREAAMAKVNVVRDERAAKARDRFNSLRTAVPSTPERYSDDLLQVFAAKGMALIDRDDKIVFAIADVGDLKRALRYYGSLSAEDRPAVRRHVQRRAKELGRIEILPPSWSELSSQHEAVMDAITMSLLAAGGRYPNGEPWDPTNHPRDEKGRFRQIIAQLKSDLEKEAGTAEAVDRLGDVEEAERLGDVDAAHQAAQEVLELVDQIAANSKDGDVVNTLRDGYGSLAEAVANMPLAFGDLNQKYRFSDLPEQLQGLIEDLYSRGKSLLNDEDLSDAGGKLSEFMSGGDVLSQPQISAELSRLLRFLI